MPKPKEIDPLSGAQARINPPVGEDHPLEGGQSGVEKNPPCPTELMDCYYDWPMWASYPQDVKDARFTSILARSGIPPQSRPATEDEKEEWNRAQQIESAKRVLSEYKELASIPFHRPDRNIPVTIGGEERYLSREDQIAIITLRILSLKYAAQIAKTQGDAKLLDEVGLRFTHEYDTLEWIYTELEDRDGLHSTWQDRYQVNVALLHNAGRSDEIGDKIIKIALAGDPVAQDMFMGQHSIRMGRFELARNSYTSALKSLRTQDASDPRIEIVRYALDNEIGRAQIAHEEMALRRGRVALLEFAEKMSGVYNGELVASENAQFTAEGRTTLIGEVWEMLDDGRARDIDGVVAIIEREAWKELKSYPNVTYEETRRFGFNKKDNPYYYANLLQIANGDRFFVEVRNIDREDPKNRFGALLKMAKWARANGHQELAGLILMKGIFVHHEAPSGIVHEARAIYGAMIGEKGLSDRMKVILADVAIESAITTVACATAGGLIAEGVALGMRVASSSLKARKYLRAARVLGNKEFQEGVKFAVRWQGFTASRQLVNAGRGYETRGYLNESISDLLMFAAIPIGLRLGNRSFRELTTGIRQIRKAAPIVVSDQRAIWAYGRPVSQLKDGELFLLTLSRGGNAARVLWDLNAETLTFMFLQSAEGYAGLSGDTEKLGLVERYIENAKQLLFLKLGNKLAAKGMEPAARAIERRARRKGEAIAETAREIAERWGLTEEDAGDIAKIAEANTRWLTEQDVLGGRVPKVTGEEIAIRRMELAILLKMAGAPVKGDIAEVMEGLRRLEAPPKPKARPKNHKGALAKVVGQERLDRWRQKVAGTKLAGDVDDLLRKMEGRIDDILAVVDQRTLTELIDRTHGPGMVEVMAYIYHVATNKALLDIVGIERLKILFTGEWLKGRIDNALAIVDLANSGVLHFLDIDRVLEWGGKDINFASMVRGMGSHLDILAKLTPELRDQIVAAQLLEDGLFNLSRRLGLLEKFGAEGVFGFFVRLTNEGAPEALQILQRLGLTEREGRTILEGTGPLPEIRPNPRRTFLSARLLGLQAADLDAAVRMIGHIPDIYMKDSTLEKFARLREVVQRHNKEVGGEELARLAEKDALHDIGISQGNTLGAVSEKEALEAVLMRERWVFENFDAHGVPRPTSSTPALPVVYKKTLAEDTFSHWNAGYMSRPRDFRSSSTKGLGLNLMIHKP